MTAAPDYAELVKLLRIAMEEGRRAYDLETTEDLCGDAADAIEALAARVVELEQRAMGYGAALKHYEEIVCFEQRRAIPGEVELAEVSTEKVGAVLTERNALRARIAALEAERDALRADTEQAARLLRLWAADRQRASGVWTMQEQAAIDCAVRLDAARARWAKERT